MDKQLKNLILIYFVCSVGISSIVIPRIFNPDNKEDGTRKGPQDFNSGGLLKAIGYIPLFKGIIWEVIHFIMYFFLGYYAPNYWYLSTTIGYLFEHFEKYMHDDHNIPISASLYGDMFANSLGLFSGIVTRLS
tara:strand:+ start:122 stop:520 length:399 start_codon:yes stop_codon:yes gene_type:complete